MAKKRLEIDLGVNTSELDNAAAKVGELRKLSDNLSIQYDIDGKPLDVVINKSLNLQKQVRVLTAELRKTKEGTAEFKLLSTALGDAQDGLARTNAKSRDLLSSLQLIPGPVGEFASQLNGVIGLLKTFSSFSLKDLQFQFKETVNDFKDIYKGFFGTKEAADEAATSISKTTSSIDSSTVAASRSSEQIRNLGSTLQYGTKEYNDFNTQIEKVQGANGMMIKQIPTIVDGVEKMQFVVRNSAGQYRDLTKAEIGAISSGKALTVTTEGIIVAEAGATAATLTFAGALQ
jgi:chromosome segregation ATPase